MNELLKKVEQVFGEVPRPEHFTDYRHCCECAEHDETLRSHTPDTIGLGELGSPAWDPICFATDEAFQYYFPALAKLALKGNGDTYYFDQFLFHIIMDGPRNRRWKVFNYEQRKVVVQVLESLLEQKTEEIERNHDADKILEALEIWSDDTV
jgi:hypothetical protein